MKILDTERLTLRTIGAADAPFYLERVNEPSWIRHIGDRNLHTLAQARAALAAGPEAMQAERGFSLYLVERRADGAAMGMCGLIKRDTLPDVDIGYAFLPRFWGQGYAHEAAAAVVTHARETVKLARLLGITGPDNESSNRLLRKLGFRFEGVVELSPGNGATNLYACDFAKPV